MVKSLCARDFAHLAVTLKMPPCNMYGKNYRCVPIKLSITNKYAWWPKLSVPQKRCPHWCMVHGENAIKSYNLTEHFRIFLEEKICSCSSIFILLFTTTCFQMSDITFSDFQHVHFLLFFKQNNSGISLQCCLLL